MRGAFISIAIIALAVESSGEELSDNRLLVDINAASIKVSARPAGRPPIRLPGLEFTIRLEPLCSAGMVAESVSVSIADTRVHIGPQTLADQTVIETTIRIPRKQIGPLAIEDFCVAGDDSANNAVLQVRDALTAQLSLKCADDSRKSIIYKTEALATTLICETAAADQFPSPPPTMRL